MTRYARAKGSKAFNERIPNDATPWHIMKQQLVEKLSKPQECFEKAKSAKELLCDKQNGSDIAKNDNTNWAEFESSYENKNGSAKKKIKTKQETQLDTTCTNQDISLNKCNDNNVKVKNKVLKRSIDEIDNSVTEAKSQKRKKSSNINDDINEDQKEMAKIDTKTENVNKKTNKSKCNNDEESVDNSNSLQIKNNEWNNACNLKNKGVLSKRQKRNIKKRSTIFQTNDTNSESINPDINMQVNHSNNKTGNIGNNQTNRFNKKFMTQPNFRNVPYKSNITKFENNKYKQKLPKIRDNKEHKRRKPDLGYSKLTINGIEVEIVKFDGFPVKKEDADRLSDLKQKMIMKGIPEKDINAAMKLERRKAEKALTRIKKCVCFHCRKAGHNLSDCPELGSEQAGTGICFKCGSTEHTHFECKVAKPTEFRYATCFICREQGHIAKQCPDNPRGVYPQGGCCKICGDVTHLKKDCPDLIKEKEENTITVNTIESGDIESLEENKQILNEKNYNKTKKVVKF